MAKALVVGYDGSGCASAALEQAIELADATGDRIVISSGYEPGSYGEEHAAHREEVRKYGERGHRAGGRAGGRGRGDAGADPGAAGDRGPDAERGVTPAGAASTGR